MDEDADEGKEELIDEDKLVELISDWHFPLIEEHKPATPWLRDDKLDDEFASFESIQQMHIPWRHKI